MENRGRQLCCSYKLLGSIIGFYIGFYSVLLLTVFVYSFFVITEAYNVLSKIQDDSLAAEVCSPLPLYTALVTSTVLLGSLGLIVIGLFVLGFLAFIWCI